jgi:asparagine synthase (glutamine-hydrolysing)
MQTGFYTICEPARDEIHDFGASVKGIPACISFDQNNDGWVLFWGSLFYQDSGQDVPSSHPDATAAAVWNRFLACGLHGVAALEGEFALVLRDRRLNRTIAMRDPMGSYPLYWTRSGPKLTIGTSLSHIRQQLSSAKLNHEYVAEYFSSPSPFNELPSRLTAVERIRRVLPGTMIVFGNGNRHEEERRFWNWHDHLHNSNPDDGAGGTFLQTLESAVAQRLSEATAAHCSGGMDSSAVALLAGGLLQRQPQPKTLTTISLVYDRLRELAVETPYLEMALAAGGSAFVPHNIQADTILDFGGFADAPAHDEPYPGLWRLGLDRATICAAADKGADTLLTGLGADEVFDQQPFHLADLLKQHRLRKAWHEATRWAMADNCNPWEFLLACGWVPAIAAGRLRLARIGRCIGNRGQMQLPDWLQPGFVKRYDLQARLYSNVRSIYDSGPSTLLSVTLDAIRARQGDFNRWYVGLPLGIRISHPFLDPRVIVRGLSLIAGHPPQPGRMKPHLADALIHTLPLPIIERRRKGHFSEVYYQGLARHEEALQELVAHTEIEPFVDKNKLSAAIALAALGGLGVSQCRQLNLALCFARWFADNRPSADRMRECPPTHRICRIENGPLPKGRKGRQA